MNFRLRTACGLMLLLIVQSARVNLNAHESATTNDTQEAEADLTPETFQKQIDEIVKPMYRNYPKDDECQFFAEGTVVMYCMAKDRYQEKLGKAAPGDIDLGHFCRGDSQPNIRKFEKYVPGYVEDGGIVQSVVGGIKIKDPQYGNTPPMLDIHQHELRFGRGARKRTAKYCLCDNECSDVPLAPLDDLKELYEKNQRNKDKGKIDFIQALMDENGGSSCGPCTAVPLKGGKSAPKPKPKPVVTVTLQDKLATAKDALGRAQQKKTASEHAVRKATEQLEAANSEVQRLELEAKQLQDEINKA